jgi:hypothetical protein
MTQSDLNRAVSRATGESVATVRRLGFLLAEPDEAFLDSDDETLGPSVLDWDAFDQRRYGRQGRECPTTLPVA